MRVCRPRIDLDDGRELLFCLEQLARVEVDPPEKKPRTLLDVLVFGLVEGPEEVVDGVAGTLHLVISLPDCQEQQVSRIVLQGRQKMIQALLVVAQLRVRLADVLVRILLHVSLGQGALHAGDGEVVVILPLVEVRLART